MSELGAGSSVQKGMIALNVAAGCSLGVLTGLLVGLSASPVVGSVLGLLVAGVLVFLSLNVDVKNAKAQSVDRLVLIRIMMFALTACLALLIGILIRSNQWLGGGLIQQQYHELVGIGVAEEDARSAIIERLKMTPIPAVAESARLPTAFGAEGAAKCATLDPSRMASVTGAIVAYTNAGGEWEAVATAIEQSVPEADRLAVLRFVHATKCASN